MVLVPLSEISSFLNSTSYFTYSNTTHRASSDSPQCPPKTATKNRLSPE